MTPRKKYEKLLRQLVELDRQGKNDSPEADAIRDDMDEPWYSMSDEDQRIMRRLSGKLNFRP